jgi:hypothetical protein
MAKPIQLGMTLEGEDAIKFDKYMENPECTPRGVLLILKSSERSRKNKFRFE